MLFAYVRQKNLFETSMLHPRILLRLSQCAKEEDAISDWYVALDAFLY